MINLQVSKSGANTRVVCGEELELREVAFAVGDILRLPITRLGANNRRVGVAFTVALPCHLLREALTNRGITVSLTRR